MGNIPIAPTKGKRVENRPVEDQSIAHHTGIPGTSMAAELETPGASVRVGMQDKSGGQGKVLGMTLVAAIAIVAVAIGTVAIVALVFGS